MMTKTQPTGTAATSTPRGALRVRSNPALRPALWAELGHGFDGGLRLGVPGALRGYGSAAVSGVIAPTSETFRGTPLPAADAAVTT